MCYNRGRYEKSNFSYIDTCHLRDNGWLRRDRFWSWEGCKSNGSRHKYLFLPATIEAVPHKGLNLIPNNSLKFCFESEIKQK